MLFLKKRTILFVFSISLLVGSMWLSSCKKDNDTTTTTPNNNNPTETYPAPISNSVTQSMIDSIRGAGGHVYSGTTPPLINGIYVMSPDSCTYDNSPGNYAGTLFADYNFRFSNQSNSTYTITVDQKNLGTGVLNSTPVSSYISGSGNNFSVFILRTTSPGGITVEQYNLLSGTITSAGIQNFQNTLYMRSKGPDPGNTVAAAGTIRVFIDKGISDTTSTF